MTLADFVARLHDPKAKAKVFKGGANGYRARCPAHDDDSPSFAVWEGPDGWLHMKCQTGCSEDDILRAMGLTQDDRRIEPRSNGQVQPTVQVMDYDYVDAAGRYLFSKRRSIGRNGKKTFVQLIRTPDRKELYRLEHLGDRSKTLYRLPEVLEAVAAGKTIYVNEGEKAVERFRADGLVATCQPAGAGPGKWLHQHTVALTGAHVVVVADRDEAGEAYASQVALTLLGKAASVRVVQSATTREKDDAWDHLNHGFTVEQFVPRPDLLELNIPGYYYRAPGDDFDPELPKYLWDPYLYEGQTCLVAGDSGGQKSSLMLGIAAAFSNGREPAFGGPCDPVSTIFCFADTDKAKWYQLIYESSHGAVGKICFLGGARPFNVLFSDLRMLIAVHRAKLVVIDPIMNYLQGMIKDANDAVQVTAALLELAQFADEQQVAVLATHHTRKAGAGPVREGETHVGSTMFKAVVRGYWLVRKHPEQPGVMVVRDVKGNIISPTGPDFAFRRHGYDVQWLRDWEPIEEAARSQAPSTSGRPSKITEIVNAIQKRLRDGAQPKKELQSDIMRDFKCSRSSFFSAMQQVPLEADPDFYILHDATDPFADDPVFEGGD